MCGVYTNGDIGRWIFSEQIVKLDKMYENDGIVLLSKFYCVTICDNYSSLPYEDQR